MIEMELIPIGAGLLGFAFIQLDLDDTPVPSGGPVAIQAGETWAFQFWFRDVDGPLGPTSNFTDAVAITFK